MAVKDLVADLVAQASASRASMANRVEEIRASKELTPEARRAQVVVAFTNHRQQLNELHAQLDGRVVAERRRLEGRLWGNPSPSDTTAAGWRAALDRAEAVESPEKASDLLARAERSGDSVLARALALHSIGRWPQVMRAYVQGHPDVAKALDDLDNFVQETGNRSKFRTAMSMTFSPSMPPEVKGTAAGQLHLAGTNR
jgi:hypothetical protein